MPVGSLHRRVCGVDSSSFHWRGDPKYRGFIHCGSERQRSWALQDFSINPSAALSFEVGRCFWDTRAPGPAWCSALALVAQCRLGLIGACSGVFLGTKIKIATTRDSQEKGDFLFFFLELIVAVVSHWNPDKNKTVFWKIEAIWVGKEPLKWIPNECDFC